MISVKVMTTRSQSGRMIPVLTPVILAPKSSCQSKSSNSACVSVEVPNLMISSPTLTSRAKPPCRIRACAIFSNVHTHKTELKNSLFKICLHLAISSRLPDKKFRILAIPSHVRAFRRQYVVMRRLAVIKCNDNSTIMHLTTTHYY